MTPLRPDASGLQPVSLIQALLPTAALGDQPSQTSAWINQLTLGQRVLAEVQAQLIDGNFLVKIGDTTTRMSLPAATQVGEKITLTVIDKTPIPTFMLNADTASPAAASSNMSLSSTAQLIATILQQAGPAAPTGVAGKTPIMAQSDLPTPQLAAALQATLDHSGLFYESHVSEWAAGRRAISQLMQEPQAAQTIQISATPVATNISAGLASTSNAPGHTDVPATTIATASGTSTDLTINNPVLANLVHQQLHTLEHHQIMWQGELWPGLPLQWEISEDATPNKAVQTEAVWRSKLSIELPQLGRIVAQFTLNAGHLSLQIHTDTPSSLQKLQAQSSRLNLALSAAGIPLAAMQIKTHD